MASFGIHLGNSSTCLAIFKDNKVEVIANDAGDRVTPAVVAINDSEKIVGLAAKAGLARNGGATVINNKRFLNNDLQEQDLDAAISSSPCKITKDNSSILYELQHGEHTATVSPDEVARWIYKKMYTIASTASRDTDLRAVLAVPLYFSQSSRKRVAQAAEDAGFTVLQVISEPAAAVLAYADDAENKNYNVLVYRVGGSSCDVSVISVSAGLYSVSSNVHRSDLGGKCFTKELANYLAGEFRQKWKLDPQESRRSMSKLMQHADNCKHVLSTLTSSHVFVESLIDGVDWSQNITRARFESLIAPKLQSYSEAVNEALEKAQINNVNKVIFCGGSMKIPKLQSTIAAMFPDAEILSRISPDEVIAEGCARQASLLAQPWDRECSKLNIEVNALTHSISIVQDQSQEELCVFPESCAIPTKNIFSHVVANGVKDISFTAVEKVSNKIFGKFVFTNLKKEAVLNFEALIEEEGISLKLVENLNNK